MPRAGSVLCVLAQRQFRLDVLGVALLGVLAGAGLPTGSTQLTTTTTDATPLRRRTVDERR